MTSVPRPCNEPIRSYAPGTAERASLQAKLDELAAERFEFPQFIGRRRELGRGERVDVVQPHDHGHVLGTISQATDAEVDGAVFRATAAQPAWADLPFEERAGVLLRAADLLAGPWRDTLNAATMLGQSKSVQQAEIDSACELIDFWRFNVAFAQRLREEQPESGPGVWNRFDHRPLEGFVLAITPFNFTAIAGNLPTAPVLMGNTVVWKPSPTQSMAAHFTMKLLEAAGLPEGVITLVTGDGATVSKVALAEPYFAGLHFTGSTKTFKHLWRTIGSNLDIYRTYPRIVGETGGKDFVVAHASADPAAVVTGLVRGAFEYQGQKCSAASRAYISRSLWEGGLREQLADTVKSLSYGDIRDFSHFGGAVIDARAFARHRDLFAKVRAEGEIEILTGGVADDSVGYFVQPTVLVCDDPADEVFRTEYFGPILAVHVFDDNKYHETLGVIDKTAEYGLTGAVFATDRIAVLDAMDKLRFAAGNFYINDKPTGAVVGQQPFGGSRASGTNDKAGSIFNLQRWISPRSIKETFVPPTGHTYPHMG